MNKSNSDHKKSLSKKFLEFQKKGLLQYGKYLDSQLKYASKAEIRRAYRKYIEDQIVMNDKKIKTIEAKLQR